MKVQITTCEGAILTGKSYLHGKWLAEMSKIDNSSTTASEL